VLYRLKAKSVDAVKIGDQMAFEDTDGTPVHMPIAEFEKQFEKVERKPTIDPATGLPVPRKTRQRAPVPPPPAAAPAGHKSK
jgi:hypothetical protein